MQNHFTQRDERQLLFHPVFIVSLSLLIANDHWFKAAHPGWLTGKLSDFAGMIVLAVLLVGVFPKLSVRAAILAGGIFLFWKLPLSEPFIRFAHDSLRLPVARVVDYSDLLALFVVPVAWRLIRRNELVDRPLSWPAWSRNLVMLTAAYACAATSAPASYKAKYDGELSINRTYRLNVGAEQALTKIKGLGYDVRPDTMWKDNSARHYLIRNLPLEAQDTLKYLRFTIGSKKEVCELRLTAAQFNHPLTQGSVNALKKQYRKVLEAGLISEISLP